MSVVTIPNQTVVFNYPLNDCDSCDPRDYCTPVLETETVDFQFKQTPCGPNLICDEYIRYLSDNLVTNGTFTGSAAGWTLGAGWAYAANIVTLTANTGALTQDLVGLITSGRYYFIRFTIAITAGTPNLSVKLGGSQIGSAIIAAGTYTLNGVADNINTLISFNDATGTATYTIDNVEVYDISPCWESVGGWIFDGEGATHYSGTNVLQPVTATLTSGVYYRIKVIVEDVTAGSMTVKLGTNAATAITASGTYLQYITANGTGLTITPTTDFNGTVSFVEVKSLKNDWTFGVLDLNDATEYTATGVAEYFEDYVTVSIDPTDWLPSTASCFKIVIHDVCTEYGGNIVEDGSFINGFDAWVSAANWVADFHSAYTLASSNSNLYQYKYDSNGDPIIRTDLKYKYNLKVIGVFPATTNLYIYTGARTLVILTAPGTYNGVVTIAAPLNNAAFQLGYHGDFVTTTKIYATDAELYPITEVDDTYTSQCFKLITDAGCTRLIEGYCSGTALGFNFEDTGFVIKQRMGVVSVNPNYPTTGSEYLFSDGERKIITAQSEKYWTFRSEFIPEWGHDALRCQKICDHFLIDSVEYFSKPDEYSPDYLGNNDYVRLSSVSFEIRKKSDTIFNNYCNNS